MLVNLSKRVCVVNFPSKRGPSSRSGLRTTARALMAAIRTYQLDRNSGDKLPRLQSRASRDVLLLSNNVFTISLLIFTLHIATLQ